MNENYPKRRTVKYVEPAAVKKAARLQALIGAVILVLSGAFLYALPAKIFYVVFIVGCYFFFSGIVIIFSIVNDRTARNLARYMAAYWLFKPKQ